MLSLIACRFALLLFEALGFFPRASGLHALTFPEVLGPVGALVVLVAVVRFAIVAPLLTVNVEKNRFGRSWQWSLIIWPPRRG